MAGQRRSGQVRSGPLSPSQVKRAVPSAFGGRMKAVKYIGGKVAVLDVPAPTGPGVRVKITSVGICGSDLTMLDSGFDIAGIPGHEMAGILADGTPGAIEPVVPCGYW